jgi:alpha-tubulin suppressor-like RCC1 family protein
MKTLRRSRRLPRLVGPATLTLGLAGLIAVAAAPAQARVSVTLAVSHVVATWGDNSWGEFGDGTTTVHATPERVTGLPVSIAGMTVGAQFTAVLGTDGSVWSWGSNALGQLNIAPPGSMVTRPVHVIAAGSRITQISAGAVHMLALRSDGTVLGWGNNQFGELGDGSRALVSGPVQVTNLGGATQVAAGTLSSYAVHTVLVLGGQSS